MKTRSAAIGMLTLVFMLLSGSALARTVTIAGDPWPPFLDPDAEEQGIAIEIVRAAYQSQGFDVEWHVMPWARALNGVREGEFDILAGTWFTEERTAYLQYSEAYLYNELKFIKRTGDDFEFEGLESLRGKVVGVVRDYGYGDDFSNADFFERDAVTDFVTNVLKLVADRVDLAIEDEIVATTLIIQHDPDLLEQVEFTENALSREGLHVSAGLQNPDHELLIDTFNTGLATIRDNGTLEEILNRHGLSPE